MAYFNPYVQMIDQANAAPLAGATSGFMQGGPIGAIAGGISGVMARRSAFRKANDAIQAIDPNPDLTDTDVYGRPTFNSSAAIEATQTMNQLGSASKRKRKGLRGLFATSDDRIMGHQMDIKSRMINEGLQSGRDQFNTQMVDYNNQQLAMAQYNQLLNNQNRLNSLYNIGTSLY